MTSSAGNMCDFGDGLLGPEREALIAAGSALIKLGMTDPAELSTEEWSDAIVQLVGTSETTGVMAGQYMDAGDQRAACYSKGEKSVVALVSAKTHVPRQRATQLLRAGRTRHRFPHFHQALIEGKITTGHVDIITRARGTLIPPSIVDEMNGRRRYHQIDTDGNLVNDKPGARHFGAVQKRMIRLCDNTCQHPGCQTPHNHCDHDHKQPFNSRGPTLVANGQLLCMPVRRLRRAAKQQSHHRWKHRHDPHSSKIFDNMTVKLE